MKWHLTVVKSRQNAVAHARDALREATEVQKAADDLIAEARSQLKGLKSKNAPKASYKQKLHWPVTPLAIISISQIF